MSKEEMLEYITGKLPELGYIGVEMVYGLIQGITGAESEKPLQINTFSHFAKRHKTAKIPLVRMRSPVQI